MNGQGIGQHRGPPAQYPNQIHSYSTELYGQPGANAVITMPPGTSFVETNRDGHTMVDITMNGNPAPQNRPNIGGYITRPMFVNVMPQYQVYPPMYQQVPVVTTMTQPNSAYQIPAQTQVAQQPQQTRQPPPPPREKKILKFINPNTNAEVSLNNQADAKPAAEPPKSESTSPAPVSVSEAPRSSTDEARHNFAQCIASAFQQGMKTSDVPKQEQTPEPEKPVLKEPTPISDGIAEEEQKIEPEPETEMDVPEKEPTPAVIESTTPRRSLSEGGERVDEIPSVVVQEVLETETGEEKSEAIDASTPPKEDKKAVLAEYEQKVVEFTQNSTNMHNLSKAIYTRDLIELLRQIIKKFKTVACPLSEEKLKEFLIDRSTMPPPVHSSGVSRVKYQQRGDNFNPTWAPSNKNMKYPGRGSDNKGKKNNQHPRAPFSGRISIQRQPAKELKRGKDAWVPATIAQKTGAEETADRIEKVRKDIRGLLNKITPSTYDELSREFINKKVWQDLDTLPTVVELIFTKAVEEPTFVGVYSDLCRLQHEAESSHMGPQKEKHFHTTVVRKCQNIFEGTTQTPAQAALQRVEEKLVAEEDPKKKELLKEEIEELKGKEKRYMLGTIKFISHLYRINLLNWKVIHFCIISLLRKADESGSELDIEFSLNLLESVGLFTNPNDRAKLDEFVVFVSKFKPKVSNRVRFMILGLEDLRSKGWEAKNQGPKTKEEVKADVIKEEAQNKRERDAYEVNTLKKPAYSGRASGPTPYSGRPSRDNKNDRKAAAVIAASTTGGSVKKDLKLQNVEKTDKLGKEPWKANRKQPVPSDEGWQTVPKKDSSIERKSNSSANLKDVANQKDGSRSVSTTPPPATDPSSSQ